MEPIKYINRIKPTVWVTWEIKIQAIVKKHLVPTKWKNFIFKCEDSKF